MITITKQNDGVLFTFENSDKYLYGNGTIEVPFNTLSIVADESDMITLKKAASNDVFISARYDTDLGYRSKDDAIDDLKDLLFAETGGGGSESGITSGEVQTMIDNSLEDYYTDDEVDAALSGKASVSDVTAVNDALTAHTANTSIHVTSAEKTTWNNKSDFSGDYNDLTNKPTIPTVPTNISDFTNDAGYITNADITGKADTSAVTAAIDAAVSGKVDSSAITTAITSGSTDAEIPTAKAAYNAITAATTGGGATYSAGTNISIDTGNTINCTIPAYFNSNALTGDIAIGTNINNVNYTYSRVIIGRDINSVSNSNAACSIGIGVYGGHSAKHNLLQGSESVGIGKNFEITNNVWGAIAIGSEAKSNIHKGLAIGYKTVASGTTQTNINNQIKVDTNNQVYIKDKDNVNEVCIQDAIAALGGLKFVQCSQSDYDAMVSGGTVDSSTIYFITNVVS